MKYTIYFILFLGLSCQNIDKNKTESNTTDSISQKDENAYVHLNKLSITGDFNGDSKIDTIYQNNISTINHRTIDSFPSNEWDSIELFFYKMGADIILTTSNKKYDTLHLGSGSGLYCLINIGDHNNDQKDEIAFVVDNCGFTNISTCNIYTLCGNKWQELKSFTIHESAFDFEGDTIPGFRQIPGFLEYRKNKWFYVDYYDWFNAENNQDTILKPLKIQKGC